VGGEFAWVPKSSSVSTMPPPKSWRPQAIDGDARRERILTIDEPAGESQPIGEGVCGQRMKLRRHSRFDHCAGGQKFPFTMTCVWRFFSAASSSITGTVGTGGRDFSSSAIESRKGCSAGAIAR